MAMSKKIVFLPYDFDTAIGINNEGSLVFSYNLEDIDQVGGANVFNGQDSVLWTMLRANFYSEIRSMYQTLRSQNILSYAVVEQMFENHQAKWPENIFNADSWYKYLAPLEEDGDSSYLTMLQGSKSAQRKWWLYNRFRYMDSKYNAGDALTDVITLRGYAKSDISITPYADVYTAVRYGSYLVTARGTRNIATTLACPIDTLDDTEIYIYSSSQLLSVGDLSGLHVGYADFSYATKLQTIKLGRSNDGITPSSSSWYDNTQMYTLYLGNNILLKSIDVRNCSGLGLHDQKVVDISGCINVETVLFEGTSITGLTLPDGGIIETLHLPDTVTIIKILNQPNISDFQCAGTSNLTTLWLENVSNAVDAVGIIQGMSASSRIRLIDFSWELEEGHDLIEIFDLFDTMRGIDQNGNNTETAQVSGTVHIPMVSTWFINYCHSRYSSVTITYDYLQVSVQYYDYDSSFLDFEIIQSGSDATGFTPTRESSLTTVYTFDGWALTAGGSVDASALENVTSDRDVYAHYAESTRYYRVRFFNGSVLADTQYVAYGGAAEYHDSDGGHIPHWNGSGSAYDYTFTGWLPTVTYITENTDTYAQYEYTPVQTRHYLTNTMTEYTDELGITDLAAYAFAGNTTLSVLNMPDLDFSETNAIPDLCFARCSQISSFTISASGFNNVLSIGRNAFWYFLYGNRMRDENENVITFTMSFPACGSIGQYAFAYSGKINALLPLVSSVGTYAFYQSYAVKLDLRSILSVGSANNNTYAYMRNIETIYWSSITDTNNPATTVLTSQSYSTLSVLDCGKITRLNSHFRNYTALKDIIFRSTTVITFSSSSVYSSGIFYASCPMVQGEGYIYVPSSLVSTYQGTTGWSTYSSFFRAIEGSDYDF